jgi:cytochrome c-type biogenesis protein
MIYLLFRGVPVAWRSGVLASGINLPVTAGGTASDLHRLAFRLSLNHIKLLQAANIKLYYLNYSIYYILSIYFEFGLSCFNVNFWPEHRTDIIELGYSLMGNISFLAAFGAGLASFVSPCVLPLIPVYFASLAGPEILDSRTASNRMPIFFHSLSFVLGFSLVFIMMGALVGLAGININPSSPLVQKVSGSLLIFFGLFMLAALKIPWLNYEKRLSPSLGATSGYLRLLLIGGTFTLAWTPCIGPILGGVLMLAFNKETAWQGAYLLTSYSLGLGLPFLIIGAAFSSIVPLLKRIQHYSRWIYIISGFILVSLGILLLTNSLTWLY